MNATTLKTSKQSRATRHAEGVTFECCDCGEVKPVQTSGGTGYAVIPDTGRLCCYACTDKRERADLLTAEKIVRYVSSNGRALQTWSGGSLGQVYFGERHPWSRERHYITAIDCHGQRWHGTGAPGMWASLRKCKA